ncbi:MAG: Gfo/Idh/MocA family oxidoreductase [Clostridia bacterium]|nr:Gfo/Idh/MocA family oxidoreductase [Clostridia bacterium]
MKPIKIAQIGIGHNHAEAAMRTMRKFPEYFEIVGVAEDDPVWYEKRKDWAPYQGIKFMTEDELLSTPGLEAVCVEKDVPNNEAMALKCAKMGLHIRMDKPGGEDHEMFKQIVELQRKNNKAFQMAYMYRYNPYIKKCLDMVRSGEIGEIFEIDCQMSSTHPAVYRDWLSNFKGGDMYIFGSHLIDLIVCMMGEPERVVSFNKNSFPEVSKCVDNGLSVLEYPRASCTVRTTSMEANGYYRRQLVVCGTNGTIEIKPLERPTIMSIAMQEPFVGNEIHTNGHPDSRKYIDAPIEEDRYDAQMIDFARVVRGEVKPEFDYDYELMVNRTVLRACGIEAKE